MKNVIKSVRWFNLIAGVFIMLVSLATHDWLRTANGVLFILFGLFVCPFILKVLDEKSSERSG